MDVTEHVLQVATPVAELDPYGELRPSAFFRLIQLAASEASCALGYGPDWYDRRGTTWIVRRTRFEQFEPARHGDELTIRTWVSDMRRVRSWRRYEVTRAGDGVPLARAATDWVYAAANGGPAAMPLELQQAFMPGGIVTEERPPRIRLPPDANTDGEPFALRAVEFADLDSLGHVNNARYADFVQQAVFDYLRRGGWTATYSDPAADHLRLTELEIEYLAPALDRQNLSAWVALAEPGNETLHATVALMADERQVAAAMATLQWTGDALPATLRDAVTSAQHVLGR